MKFTLFTQAAMAIPFITGALAIPTPDVSEAKRADCSMTVRYRTDWVEKGLDRYRMQLITSPRNDRHLGVYCDAFKAPVGFVINPQCFWGDAYYVDVSAARGPAGRRAVRDAHNKACNDFEVYTGCRTIREF
ncbi:hypothetical protein FPANT_873 [Fusarium pseudoanthophilum]|uniref:Uncharacterized protein n=1 Tax=Fusarium pseudoanthophilum TaxID=48495 RepID=A0A8H5V1J6_9HYPO|nr:hypothetical protein FPANT_873 [Fusarium pseudoanthophilum]